ncbi:MAG: hypothetical protein WBE97_00360 [Candidatus Acidiferrales bacterium]
MPVVHSSARVSPQGIPGQIDEDRAAAILGFSRETLRRMSGELGIGHKNADAATDTIVFTYEELYRLCRSSIRAL